MNRQLSLKYFDLFIRALALLQILNFIEWKFFHHDNELLFKYAVIPALDQLPEIIHQSIFVFYIISSILFTFTKKNYVYCFLIALSLSYFELHDKFSFHQDIFLAINIFFLYGLIRKEAIEKRFNSYLMKRAIICLKILVTLVYFFAGINKLNSDFHGGLLIADILSNGILRDTFNYDFFLSIAPFLAIFTMVMELSVPFLIWTKYRNVGFLLAILSHFGMSFFGARGLLFNLYLPSTFILFYNVPLLKVRINDGEILSFLKKINLCNQLSFSPNYDKATIRLFIDFIFLNPLFLILFLLYSYHFTRIVVYFTSKGIKSLLF